MKSEQFQVVSLSDTYEEHPIDHISSGFREYGIKMINSGKIQMKNDYVFE